MNFNSFTEFLPSDGVLLSEESKRVYECDALSAHKVMPGCVLLPDSVEQVQKILSHSHLNDIPVVARGAGTGLSGGAMPHAEGVLLSLAKFNKILEELTVFEVIKICLTLLSLSNFSRMGSILNISPTLAP